MCLILQLRIITEDENEEEPEENIPIVDGVPVEENNVEDGDNGDDDEIQEVDNTMDSLQQGLEMMNLGNRPSNLPPTTPGLFVIPPRLYLNVNSWSFRYNGGSFRFSSVAQWLDLTLALLLS